MTELNGSAERRTYDRAWRVGRVRFWIESLIAGAALILGLLTLVWRDWIEGVFGVDPDGHSGGLEWLVVVGLLFVAAVMGGVARFERGRLQPAVTPSSAG